MERFWSKVVKTDYCWHWIASLRNGYGAFKIYGLVVDAHRVSYQLSNGNIADGKMILHKCNNKICVNPNHLYEGNRVDNANDSITAGTHHIPAGIVFEKGHTPKNRVLSDREAIELRSEITTRSGTLKELSKQLNKPYQLLRDISCGRGYVNT